MMRSALIITIWALLAISSPAALAIDSRAYVERAVALIESGDYELARSYLEPALIDGRLDPGERSRAYYLRGYSFFAEGMYVSAYKDYSRALEFYPANPIVLTAVAQMHLEGLGVKADPALGVEFLKQAAKAHHPPASLRLGVVYLRGIGVPQNVDTARKWLTQAADAGLATAMEYLGQSYEPPFADPPDLKLARQWLEKAVKAGDAEALAHLGFLAEGAAGGQTDPAAARDYFEKAAAAGSGLGEAKLAHMYLTGDDGVTPDAGKALELFQKSAAKGQPAAYMGLAYLYDSGTGVPRDEKQARQWYEKAAGAGLASAQLRLAYLGLARGDLAGQQDARKWLSQAAAQNDLQALNDYAWLLATSRFDAVRDGPQAVTMARAAVSRKRTPAYLDTLAAAYAETGKFDRAVETQQQAIALAGGKEKKSARSRERPGAAGVEKPHRRAGRRGPGQAPGRAGEPPGRVQSRSSLAGKVIIMVYS